MKKSISTVLLIAMIVFGAQAQQKIGYFDANYVMPQLPEAKAAQTELKTYATKLQEDLATKEQELKEKYQKYLQEATTMPDPTREAYEKELQALQKQIADFQQSAEKSIQEKQQALMNPIYVKVENTLKEVAKANGYAYIIRREALLYEPEGGKDDISPLVLKKLGITPAPVTDNK
ncbi:MAG: OmpH family outer membrane protein [Thermonemataceae bacterium]